MGIDDKIMMYAMTDDLEYGIPVDVRIIGTGNVIKDDIDNYKFLGTVSLMKGIEIWHVFARHSKNFLRVGEKKEDDIPILSIHDFTNLKEEEFPKVMMV